MSKAGISRADGQVITSIGIDDKILIQQLQSNGQYLPRLATYSSFIAGGGSATEASNAVTLNSLSGIITTSSLTTAAGNSYVITLTNSYIDSSSARIFITRVGGTNTRHNFQIDAAAGTGSATITIYNTEPSNALNGTVIFNFFVLP